MFDTARAKSVIRSGVGRLDQAPCEKIQWPEWDPVGIRERRALLFEDGVQYEVPIPGT